MLKGIDPRLNADVLYVLRAMGHGDTIVIVDRNFPADATARHTTHGSLLRMENLTAVKAVQAVLSVMPLDTFGDEPACRMAVIDDPKKIPPVQQEVQREINTTQDKTQRMCPVDRFDFYDRARAGYAVIQTGERRLYGCFQLRKGIILPDE